MPLDGPERRRRKAPIVVEPPPKFGIDLPGKLLDGLPRTAMQLPSSNLVPDFLRRFLRDSWTETTEDLPFPSVRFPRPKRVPQKVKLLVGVRPSSIGILAIDHFRLLRMQFQPTLLQPCRYFDTHQVRFPFCSAMNDEVSSARESHPDALAEPYVNVSAHTAPAMEPRRTPICQCAHSFGSRLEIRATQCVALRKCLRSFLYFRSAHRAGARSS